MTGTGHGRAGWSARVGASREAGAWALVLAVVVALVWANGPWASSYTAVWLHPVHLPGPAGAGLTTVRTWVNGALMAVFFLMVGLEIARERRHGDLADARTAVAPVAGALGGMAGAGLVYAAVAHGGPAARGWGVPLATDIAFSLAVLALFGRQVPPGLRVFLLTLAVADDIGSLGVLAVFYSGRVRPAWVLAAVVATAVLVVVRRRGWLPTGGALAGGAVLWGLLAAGGAEPALAGVVAGLLVPGRAPGGGDPAARLERRVAPVSAFVVLPVFAVANAGITFHTGMLTAPGATTVLTAVAAARVLGKPAGIVLGCLLVVRLGPGALPPGVRWRHVAGMAAVAGVGFTVPLLFAVVSFPADQTLVSAAELGLFLGSVAAAAAGAAVLGHGGTPPVPPVAPESADPGGEGADLPW